jgi:hypothetical protein
MSDFVFANDPADGAIIANVNFLKDVMRRVIKVFETFQVTGVGEAIEIDKSLNLRAPD